MEQVPQEYLSFNDYYAWPKVPGTKQLIIQDMLDKCLESQWKSSKKIKAGQIQQVEMLLTHARTHSPFYQHLLSQINMQGVRDFSDVWKQIPSLEPNIIAQAGQAMAAKNIPVEHGNAKRSAMVLPGMAPMPILTSDFWMAIQSSWFARQAQDHGWDQQATLIDLGPGNPGQHKEIRAGWGFATTSGPHFAGNYDSASAILPNWLTGIEGDIYLRFDANTLPNVLSAFDSGALPNLKGLMVNVTRKAELDLCTIARKKGISAIAVIIIPGLGMIAATCPEEGTLHIQSESVLVEKVRNQTLITSLHNFAMPLVRVNTGLAFELLKNCRCGRGQDAITLRH